MNVPFGFQFWGIQYSSSNSMLYAILVNSPLLENVLANLELNTDIFGCKGVYYPRSKLFSRQSKPKRTHYTHAQGNSKLYFENRKIETLFAFKMHRRRRYRQQKSNNRCLKKTLDYSLDTRRVQAKQKNNFICIQKIVYKGDQKQYTITVIAKKKSMPLFQLLVL